MSELVGSTKARSAIHSDYIQPGSGIDPHVYVSSAGVELVACPVALEPKAARELAALLTSAADAAEGRPLALGLVVDVNDVVGISSRPRYVSVKTTHGETVEMFTPTTARLEAASIRMLDKDDNPRSSNEFLWRRFAMSRAKLHELADRLEAAADGPEVYREKFGAR